MKLSLVQSQYSESVQQDYNQVMASWLERLIVVRRYYIAVISSVQATS